MNVNFSVMGRPVPQGSKRGVVTPGTGRVHMIESSKGLPDWRAQVSHEAARACPRGPTDLPVTMHATFVFSLADAVEALRDYRIHLDRAYGPHAARNQVLKEATGHLDQQFADRKNS